MAKSGSIIRCSLNGPTYIVAADANAAKTPSKTVEAEPHSGGNQIKVITATGNVESLTLVLSPTEYQQLEALLGVKINMSYTLADGSVWTAPGYINLDNS